MGEATPAADPAPAADAKEEPAAKRQKVEGAGPPLYAAGGYVDAGGGWHAHSGGEWLYSVEEKTYFHLPSGQLHLATDDGVAPLPGSGPAAEAAVAPPEESAEAQVAELRGRVKWFNSKKGFGFIEPMGEEGAKDLFVHRNQLRLEGDDVFASLEAGSLVGFNVGETDNGRPCAVNVRVLPEEDANDDEEADDADGASSSGESIELDVEEELRCGLHSDKGPGKENCEDFAVEKSKLPITVLTDQVQETATCFFFGVFDGHGGKHCAEYCADHLAKNIMARLRDRTKTASDEVAMKTALLGGFKQTEHNFIHKAKRSSDMSGSTACTMVVFGPDEQMRLRLFMANLGDSRAVLGKLGGKAVRLTEDHKPNLKEEKRRVDAAGGSVAEVAGIWRVILPAERRLPGTTVGLAVSRAFGDKEFKSYKGADIVGAEPEVTVHEVDWDADEFVILASDGIWDVLSDREAVRIVQQSLRQKQEDEEEEEADAEAAPEAEGTAQPKKRSMEEKAAEVLVKKAREKGSKDDATAMVVKFGWLKIPEDEAAAAPEPAEDEDEEGRKLRAERQALVEEGARRLAEMQVDREADAPNSKEEAVAAALEADSDDEDDAAEPMGLSIMPGMGVGPAGLFGAFAGSGEDDDATGASASTAAPSVPRPAAVRKPVTDDDDIFASLAADGDADADNIFASGQSESASDMAGGLFDELPAPKEAEVAPAFFPALPTSGMGAMPVSAMPVGALDAAALASSKAKKGTEGKALFD